MLAHLGDWILAHLFCAGLVIINVWRLAVCILRPHSGQVKLARPVTWLIGLLVLQLLLGLGSYVNRFTSLEIPYSPFSQLALPTIHRITASLMLAACIVLTLRAYRQLAAGGEATTGRSVLAEQVRA